MALCSTLGRYKTFVDTTDLDLSAHLLIDGFWEWWVTRAIVELVRPGMTCADIGAHLGYFSLLMADLVGRDGRVLAFEPNPGLRTLLDLSARLNGFSTVIQSFGEPLSDGDGLPVDLVIPPGQPGGAHLTPGDESSAAYRTRRLDGIAGAECVDLIKIDAEASEEAIWRGMSGILAQRRPLTVLIEFTLARYAEPGAFLDAILAEGFSLRRIYPGQGIRPIDRGEVFKAPPAEDQMLVLTR